MVRFWSTILGPDHAPRQGAPPSPSLYLELRIHCPRYSILYRRYTISLHHQPALRIYEVQIKAFADSLERLIAQCEGQTIAVNEYFQWFSFDVTGQIAFSKSFNMLENGTWHPAIQTLRSGMALVGPFTPLPWLMQLGADMPATPLKRMFAWCAEQMDDRMKVCPLLPSHRNSTD